MSGDGQLDQTIEGGSASDTPPACVALVPMRPSVERSRVSTWPLSRPNSCFVTQLIATAEQAPQTRNLRRATPADAQAAYRSATDHNHLTSTGIRTRQTS